MNVPSPPEPHLSLVGAVDVGGERVDVECAGGTIVAVHRGAARLRH